MPCRIDGALSEVFKRRPKMPLPADDTTPIIWYKPFPPVSRPARNAVLVDIEARGVQELAEAMERDDPETAALLYHAAERLDRLQSQVDALRASSDGYDAGVRDERLRHTLRQNIDDEALAPRPPTLREMIDKFGGVVKRAPVKAPVKVGALAAAGITLKLNFGPTPNPRETAE